MDKNARVDILNYLVKSVHNKKATDLIYQIVCEDEYFDVLCTYITMYAAANPLFLGTLRETVIYLLKEMQNEVNKGTKDGTTDPTIN